MRVPVRLISLFMLPLLFACGGGGGEPDGGGGGPITVSGRVLSEVAPAPGGLIAIGGTLFPDQDLVFDTISPYRTFTTR